jgi:hypothetical protein
MIRKQVAGAGRSGVYLDRVLSGVALIALHEAGSVQGHFEALGERVRVASRARGVGELLRDQVDLFPESGSRWRRDHRVRRELWNGVIRDLRAVAAGSPGSARASPKAQSL